MKTYLKNVAISTAARSLQGAAMIGGGLVLVTKAATQLADGLAQAGTAAVESAVVSLSVKAHVAEAEIKEQNSKWSEKRQQRRLAAQAAAASKKLADQAAPLEAVPA